MTIVACPKCADSVVLPGRASRLATVRCPLCQEQFPLAEVLDKMPPALVVVDDPEAAATAVAPAGGTAADELVAAVFSDSAGAGGFAPLSIETEGAPATGAPRGRRPVARAKRKHKSPLVEGLKIVLGGVAGLAIAQVILWWLGSSQSWPKQRADMFELAPKVARFAPWIVPERYRSGKPAGDASGTPEQDAGAVALSSAEDREPRDLPQRTFVDPNASNGAGGSATNKPATPKKSGRSANKKTPQAPVARDPLSSEADDAAPTEEPDMDLGQIPEPEDDPLADMNLDLEPTDDKPVADPEVTPVMEPESETATEAKPAAEPKPAAVPLPNAPRTTAAELRTAVDEAKTVVEALKAAPEADSRALLRQTYVALAKVGETAAFRAPPEMAELQSADDLLKTVIAEEEKLATLGKAAGGWLKTSSRDNNGVLLVGTVKEVRQQGGYRVIELAIPGRDGMVAVYSEADSGEAYPPDTGLVVLGAIIADPAKDLAGYEGAGDPVVWQGMVGQLATP